MLRVKHREQTNRLNRFQQKPHQEYINFKNFYQKLKTKSQKINKEYKN